MTKAMSQTSIENYLNIVKPNITNREEWVLEAIEAIQPCSIEQVARHLDVGDNIVSGRFTGLRKKGFIGKHHRALNSRNCMVDYYVTNRG